MGAADLTVGEGTEGKAGEGLTGGSDGEGGSVHEVRCFDSFNIQEMTGEHKGACDSLWTITSVVVN